MVGEENLVLATMGIAEVSIQSGGRLAHDPGGKAGLRPATTGCCDGRALRLH